MNLTLVNSSGKLAESCEGPMSLSCLTVRCPMNTGLGLEERCAVILEANDWRVERTPRSHDGGVDLIATRLDEIGIEQTIYMQCKDNARPVGVEVIRELLCVTRIDGKVQPTWLRLQGLHRMQKD